MKSARPISTTASKRLSTSLGNSYKAFPGSASSFGSPRSQSGSHSDVFKVNGNQIAVDHLFSIAYLQLISIKKN
ncbi:expressed protein [Batrachochytrium dendrobatidis JAM81]|uniref:Expressed protein n=1 Tax=Batrachochytrium dendrobatidis (strain JAM81 / FGSC 10211) TaxID=684364 RepID=F4NZD8_BATDJ|nr:uncharacterized protein BATDEDRAFT_29841 [Batrachochytrium dendrobatidis JAM81]XP_006678242.1 uncharacterized protein BATDEDRAFT_87690 [Batrachochytrium dendrobatidis JAM81]EGF81553.1 hypothetical protein BATDEDRAFT_87690 [Batrachochytrium dendrobatidis JAM81]EGF81557.1 expressed protein [Batrachochytrium dendrobatidis JAM81]|eukprot:XP_006677963.1 expressed protein [Batrachochytrium dendrobatidis JAM81]